MKLPSKELLSEVLERDAFVRGLNQNGKTLRYCFVESHNRKREINIAELALIKCKEWAKLKHFIDIDSHPGCARWGAKAVSHNGKPSVFYEQVFIGRTETYAIFKACEWILKEMK